MELQPPYIDCVILCGGDLKLNQGKKEKLQCMVTIEKRPFLSYILDQLSAFNFEDVILAVDENSKDLRRFFEDRYAFVNFSYSYEDYPLGTIGAAKKAIIEFGDNQDILIVKGNIYTHLDIFDLRNFFDYYKRNNNICALSYDSPYRLIKNNSITEQEYYSAGFYLIRRDILLDLPDNYSLKDLNIKDHFILRMKKNKSLDINIVENNHKNIKEFFRDIWGYDWSRYEYFDDGIKKCLYCKFAARMKIGKHKYHGWRMRCSKINEVVDRMMVCEKFEIKGDKPYFHGEKPEKEEE